MAQLETFSHDEIPWAEAAAAEPQRRLSDKYLNSFSQAQRQILTIATFRRECSPRNAQSVATLVPRAR